MEWLLQIKGVPDVVVKVVTSLWEGGTKEVRVSFVVSHKFFVNVGSASKLCIINAFVCSSDRCGDGGCKKWCVLYTDDLVLMSESKGDLQRKFSL